MSDPYIIYGGELSYFTRKLEAACIFYGMHFEMRSKNRHDPALIESRSGTHQVPVMQTPENWMIGDTTPLMHLLDARFPHRRMFPEGPIGVLVQVVEEYFDEWIARTMVHYRWHYPDSALFASTRMADGMTEVAERVRGWGPRACRATGTESEGQRRAAEAEYVRILEAAEAQLAKTPTSLATGPARWTASCSAACAPTRTWIRTRRRSPRAIPGWWRSPRARETAGTAPATWPPSRHQRTSPASSSTK